LSSLRVDDDGAAAADGRKARNPIITNDCGKRECDFFNKTLLEKLQLCLLLPLPAYHYYSTLSYGFWPPHVLFSLLCVFFKTSSISIVSHGIPSFSLSLSEEDCFFGPHLGVED
jgi:hypothetical protein